MKKDRGRHQMMLVEVLKKDMTIKKITEYDFNFNRMMEKNTFS